MTSREIVEAYMAAWNEPDEGARRKLLEACWTDDGTYTDPTAHVEGREALVEHIAGYLERMPGCRIVLASGIDEHHDRLRFGWAMNGPDGVAMVEGIDVGTLDAGRLSSITGFFGPLPD